MFIARLSPQKLRSSFREINPDLICLDIRMPEVDGFQVMGQLKIVNKRPYLPILVLTSEEDRGDSPACA